MFQKLLAVSGPVALYLGASLVLAQLLLLGYLTYAWKLTPAKWYQMLAIAQGVDMFQTEAKLRQAVEDRVASLTWEEIRALRTARDMEQDLVELTTDKTGDITLLEAKKLDERRAEFDRLVRSFQAKLDDLDAKTKDTELRRVTTMLERMDATLAKQQLLEMFDNNQVERVVTILKTMQERPRGSILNEMTKDDEVKKLADILSKIASGTPVTDVINEAQAALNQVKP